MQLQRHTVTWTLKILLPCWHASACSPKRVIRVQTVKSIAAFLGRGKGELIAARRLGFSGRTAIWLPQSRLVLIIIPSAECTRRWTFLRTWTAPTSTIALPWAVPGQSTPIEVASAVANILPVIHKSLD